MHSIYRLSDAQPDWLETDPSQPDYIKNKEQAEKIRPIMVNGEEFLDDTQASGAANFVAGTNVSIRTEGNKIIISSEGGQYELTEEDKEEIKKAILADFDISDIEGEFAEKVEKADQATTWNDF